MAHLFRFFAKPKFSSDDNLENNSVWSVTGDEHHHLRKVLRLSVEEKVELISGDGVVVSGEIAQISSSETIVRVMKLVKETPQSPRLLCCLGALKGSSLDDLLPSLVELGVDEFHVFLSKGDGKFLISDKAQKRWISKIEGATKQSKRSYLPTLKVWGSLSELGEALRPRELEKVILTVPSHFSEKPEQLINFKFDKDSCLLIGSEKGFTHEQEEACERWGFQKRTVGFHVLRSTTASLAAVAILSSQRSKQGL